MMNCMIAQAQVCSGSNITEVKWEDGHVSRFHAKWLRFNCHCKRCKPAFSGLYLLDVEEFPAKIYLKQAYVSDRELKLEYENEVFKDHVTSIPADWLRSKCYCDECLQRKLTEADVIKANIKENEKKITRELSVMDYKEIVDDPDGGAFKMLSYLIKSGACVVRNVPAEEGMVVKVAELVSYVETSTYGKIFDVTARNEENAAYTNFKLPFHQDQPFYEICPGVQLLHAVRFDDCVTGGESLLTDVFEAAETLRVESPDDFKALVEIPTRFATIDFERQNKVYLEHQKPHISLDYFGNIVGVNWHPAIVSTLQVREQDVDRYYNAYSKMLSIVRRKESQFRFKLKAGDVLVFNNRRMLHAREYFSTNGGIRHLQGTYLKLDEMKSKYMTLAKKLNIEVVPPKVGNNSSI